MIRIRDILQSKGSKVWSIGPHEVAFKALEIMAEKNIGALLVIENEKIVGIFSERDYARKVILKGKSSKDTSVADLMTTDIYSLTTDKTVEECMALMTAAHCRHMPVIENQQLKGIVAIGDVVNAIIAEKDVTIHDLEHYISGNEYVETSG